MRVFVDSNVPMYVAGRDHPNKERARRFLDRVRSREVDACTSTEVLQEVLYRYSALGRLDLAGRVYELFVQLCPTVFPVVLADTDRACRILCRDHADLSARDAVHASVMLNNDVTLIATFDRGFDRIAGLRRFDLS